MNYFGNMDADGLSDILRRREAAKLARTDCLSSGTLCKYGRSCRPSKLEKEEDYETNVKDRKFHQQNSSRRKDIFNSKFRRRNMPTDFIITVVLCCLLTCEARNSARGTRPRVNTNAEGKVIATVGDSIVLRCPVTAFPPPLTKWSVNGRAIHSLKSRFKVGFDLRIRKVRANDAGRYRCTARNAFGVVGHGVDLFVTDPEGKPSPCKPRFTMADKMRRQSIVKPVGRSLRLHCKASGYPTPKVEWYKDGNATGSRDGARRPGWSLNIRRLKADDSGHYMCRVWNSEGEIKYTYDVRVVDKLRERPVLLDPHPINTTVQVGGTTTIQCRVQSRVEPTVKWIKRLDDEDMEAYGGREHVPKNIVTIDDRHYMILPTQEMLHLAVGPYLNKLVIKGATEKHGGMYICLAANTVGYNFKYAYLNVVSGPVNKSNRSTSRAQLSPGGHSSKKGSISLPAVILVPAGVGLILVASVTWVCLRRRKQRLKTENASVVVSGSALGCSEATPSAHSAAVPCAEAFVSAESSRDGAAERRPTGGNNGNCYAFYRGPPPVSGTPLLTVDESSLPEDNGSIAPGSDGGLPCRLGPPPPPPPSQRSASSFSSRANRNPRFPHHFYYMHPPGGARRHYHRHAHSPASNHSYYSQIDPSTGDVGGDSPKEAGPELSSLSVET